MQECVKGVYDFNNMCHNFEDVTKEKLLAQAAVVREESNELFKAVWAEEGETQILKETVDVLVTIVGMVGMLESRGHDVVGAWKAVNDNNMTKGIEDLILAQYSKIAFDNTDTPVTIEYNEQVGKYILRDINGKVRKHLNYEQVDVSQFVPILVRPK